MKRRSRNLLFVETLGLLIALAGIILPAGAEDDANQVVTWRFGTEETQRLKSVGGVHRDQAGPRSPEFPNFDTSNLAVKLDGKGARFVAEDPGVSSDFDFDNGDEITIEAWVNVTEPFTTDDRNVYVIGKGRTGDKGFESDNQNWALRLRSIDGVGRVSFLFATAKDKTTSSGQHWHRWTSNEGFYPGTGWHRIAVQYRFGQPTSIRGWLNERKLEGKWDMGGSTTEAPVVDNDSIWIGSAMSGNPSNSFQGMIDEISLFRKYLSEDQMSKRYRRVGPDRNESQHRLANVPPDFAPVPGAVAVRVFEGLAAHDRWTPRDTFEKNLVYEYASGQMFFPRLPLRYDAWGILASWKPTTLLQAVTELELPSGKHQLLLRSRGLCRVWLNDTVVAKLATRKGGTDGHNPVEAFPEPPAPEHRILPFGDQEVVVDLVVNDAGPHRLTLETLVGSAKSRAEPGETLVAIRRQGQHDFLLVQPDANKLGSSVSQPIAVKDEAIEQLHASTAKSLADFNDFHRRKAASTQDSYWQRRHQLAQDWVAQHPAPEVPESTTSDSAHPIDCFIDAKIVRALSDKGTGDLAEIQFFHKEVKPILDDNCMRCHGQKEEGGLKLLSRESLLAGGDSGPTTVIPGNAGDSELMTRVSSTDPSVRMPPSGNLPAEKVALLEKWIASGAAWGQVVDEKTTAHSNPIDDAAFLRRAFLDTCGVPPTESEAREFIASQEKNKREKLIDQLLEDPRMADNWVSYWQDILAENPNILKPSLNNTGPFRYYLYDSMVDHKSLDRMVSELIMLRGSEREGGSAGFGMAADNDSPLATRSIVLASAFLGINLQCARCHDSPYHSTTQSDLFATASMMARKPLTVPNTSTVAPGFFEKNKERQSLIKVTLATGVPVEPKWCFADATGMQDGSSVDALLMSPEDSRERLAALVTSPNNLRFASVMVNRIWKRLIGAGLVEPVDDWENQLASHPELLEWLAKQFVQSGYDMRELMRTIMTSQLYQRAAVGNNLYANSTDRFFAAPDRRRLTAEQIVDSLFAASGHVMKTEELTFDNDSRRPADVMISLGKPQRAWQFAALSNERDRPSLALPRAQAITDVLSAFGWTGSRQNAISTRESAPDVLQPGIVAGGVMATWICRVSDKSRLADLAVSRQSPEELAESLFLRFLSRLPNDQEKRSLVDSLSIGFDQRKLPEENVVVPSKLPPLGIVGWTNHLRSEANEIMLEHERRARIGDPADPRIESDWRESFEDVIWALINSPEFVWVP